MQNLHRHSSYSNITTGADSAASNEDYAKRAVELGHKVLSSVEHGWQGNYFQTYELAKKYGLKPVIGTEAYWVKDRIAEIKSINKKGEEVISKDRSNHHILILAKSNMGREAINDILSEANISSYYFRPRVDLGLLFSLPPKDVMITSACIAFSGYDDIDDIILQFHDYFGENFYLEQQNHNTEKQKIWSEHLLNLSDKYNIPMSVGLDSHFILPKDSQMRDYILEAKDIHYEDEQGWYMDYPSDEETIKRFKEQGILSDKQIQDAMNATDQALEFCDYDNIRIFTKDIKLPTLYPGETKEQKDKRYSKLISKKFVEYMKNIPSEDYDKYYEGVKAEVQTYKDTGMCDYPLLDYAIVKDAVEHGGLITDSGRGSAVGFFTNTLCGFSKVDRFKSAIKLYPERFISTTRILSTKSLPDIDLNVGTPEIFEESQKRVLGENHVAPMIAFGTLKKRSAFKIYAKAKNMDFELANTITNQIGKYEEAVKNAPDESKDSIDIHDYIDAKYEEYLKQSEEYWGVISDKKKAPSAYLLYDGDIRREIGLIKCKSESSKKEYITCVIDGAIAENYKFLKNDILKVDVVLLIDKVFKRIGIEHFDVNKLLELIKDDQKVWDLYANGYTIGLNQVEQEGSRRKCMTYKPHNISELSAFVAAIRPGFKSMYNRFEQREDFSWGIPTLDNLIRTEELPVSFMFFQEQVMSVLNYAGFPMDECYGIIKAIAKKHPEKVKPLKEKFIEGFKEKLIQNERLSEEEAQKNSNDVWQIVNDNCGYSFNSAHAFCMALDSLYQAWQKANYPYEFYEVLLQHYSDKGNKNKVSILKEEMRTAFGITEGHFKFRDDNRHFAANKENHFISPSLSSIKGMGDTIADDLYNLRNNKYSSFIELLDDLKTTSCKSSQLDILVKLDYFSEFGDINYLLKVIEYYDILRTKKQLKHDQLRLLNLQSKDIEPYAEKVLAKVIKIKDSKGLLEYVIHNIKEPKCTIFEKMKYQNELLGYISIIDLNLDDKLYFIQNIIGTESRRVFLYQMNSGISISIKIRKSQFDKNPVKVGQIIQIKETINDRKWRKIQESENQKPQWIQIDEREDILTKYSVIS